MEFLFYLLLLYLIFRLYQPSENEVLEAKKREIDRDIELEKYKKSQRFKAGL